MDTNLNVAIAPKDSTFQVRINSEIKRAVEDIYAKTGMTLTDAFNTFIQECSQHDLLECMEDFSSDNIFQR